MLTAKHVDNSQRDAALAAMGLKLDEPDLDEAPPAFALLPDVADSINVVSSMMTQWHVGPGGAVGMRYEALDIVLRLRRVPRGLHQRVFDDVRVCESAALDHFAALRAQND